MLAESSTEIAHTAHGPANTLQGSSACVFPEMETGLTDRIWSLKELEIFLDNGQGAR